MKKVTNVPKISVIIPVYNTELYLRECLDSVINQTLKDIEIICVNDGSTDNSGKFLEEYAQKDTRIKVIHQRNMGVAVARNHGIKTATGAFVCFIDPDDVYPTNDVLKVLYNAATKHKVLICGGEFSRFTNEDKTFMQSFDPSLDGYLFKKSGIIKYTDYQFDYGYHRFIYNRKFLIKNSIFFPDYKRFQDPSFFVNAMIKAKKFYAVHKITYGYRTGHQSVNWSKQKINDLLMGITDNLRYAKQNGLDRLSHYSLIRLQHHFSEIKDSMTKQHWHQIKQMGKYNDNVAKFYIKNHTVLNKFKTVLKQIFSINSLIINGVKYRTITIFGIKIRIKMSRRNKIFHKERRDNGDRRIYIFGLRIFSYNKQKIRHALEYPVRVHDKYHRLKDKIKELKK